MEGFPAKSAMCLNLTENALQRAELQRRMIGYGDPMATAFIGLEPDVAALLADNRIAQHLQALGQRPTGLVTR